MNGDKRAGGTESLIKGENFPCPPHDYGAIMSRGNGDSIFPTVSIRLLIDIEKETGDKY